MKKIITILTLLLLATISSYGYVIVGQNGSNDTYVGNFVGDGSNLYNVIHSGSGGSVVTSVLTRTVVNSFQQNTERTVDGVVMGVYDNSILSNDVYTTDYNLPNKEQFEIEEISGFKTFIVGTNGYYGKFTTYLEGTKLEKGCSLYINNMYYPIVNINGTGLETDNVQLQYSLEPNTTQTISTIYGVIVRDNSMQMSFAYDPFTTNALVVSSGKSWDAETWCCSDDGMIHYFISGRVCYKSIDGGVTFSPICNMNTYIDGQTTFKMFTRDGTNVYWYIWINTIATQYPIYVSTNGMQTYENANFPVNQYHDLYIAKDTNIIMVADAQDGQIRISTNNGALWVTNGVVGARNYQNICCNSNGQIIVVGQTATYVNQFYYSTNFGLTWKTNATATYGSYPRLSDITPDGSNLLITCANDAYAFNSLYINEYELSSTGTFNRTAITIDLDRSQISGIKRISKTDLYIGNRWRLYTLNRSEYGDLSFGKTLFGSPYDINVPNRIRIQSDGDQQLALKKLSINPIYPNIWYAMGYSGYYPYLWMSTDYGTTWTRVRADYLGSTSYNWQPPVSLGSTAIWPYWVSHVESFTDTRHSIYKSDDFGRNWYPIQGQRGPYMFVSMPTTNIIYAKLYQTVVNTILNSQNLVKSVDGGNRFYLMGGLGTRQVLQNISVASYNGKTNILISGRGDVTYSTPTMTFINNDESNNDTWSLLDISPEVYNLNAKAIQQSDDNLWSFVAYYGYIYQRNNVTKYNTSWVRINSLNNVYTTHVEQHLEIFSNQEKTNFYMGIYALTNIIVSTNNFASVDRLTNSPKLRWSDFSTHDGNIIWAAGSTNATIGTYSGHAFVSTNGGTTWSNKTVSTLLGSTPYIKIWSIDGTNAYMSFNSKFYKTTDMGDTWTVLYGNTSFACSSIGGDRNNRYVGNKMWVTVNGTTRGVHCLYSTTNEFASLEPAGNPNNGIPDPINSYFNDHYGNIVSPAGNPNTVYVGKRNGFVYQSNDGGTNWIKTDLFAEGLSRDWLITANGDRVYAVRVYPYLTDLNLYTVDTFAEVFVSYGNETPNPANPQARVFNRLNIVGDITNRAMAVRGVEFIGDTLYFDNGFNWVTYKDDGNLTAVPTNLHTVVTKSGIDTKNWATVKGVSISDLSMPELGANLSHLFSFDGGQSYMKYDQTNWNIVVSNRAGTYYYRVAPNSYANGTANLPFSISESQKHDLNRFYTSNVLNMSESKWVANGGFNSSTTTNILISTTFIPPQTNMNARTPSIFNTKIGSTFNTDYFMRRDTNYQIMVVGTNTMSNTVRKIGGPISDAVIYYMKGL